MSRIFNSYGSRSSKVMSPSMLVEQVRLLLDAIPFAVTGGIIASALATSVFWSYFSHEIILIWGALYVSLQLTRAVSGKISLKYLTESNAQRLRKLFRLLTFLSGVAWGALPVFLSRDNFTEQVFLGFILAGMVGAATSNLSMDSRSALFFVTPALLSYALILLLTGERIQLTLSALTVVYFAYLVVLMFRGERGFVNSIMYREEAELRFNGMSEAQRLSHLGTWNWDTASGEMDWSSETYRICGIEPRQERISLDRYMSIVHPEDRKSLHDAIVSTVSAKTFDNEHRIVITKDDVRWVHARGELISGIKGKADTMRGTLQDITEYKKILYEKERENLALNYHAIVSKTDKTGKITHINDLFCKISGYTRDELMGQNHRIIKSDQHEPEFYKDMWKIISKGDVWQGEFCNRRKDGSLYWVESTIVPFLDVNGKPYQYVSIRTDITHLKQIMAALHESEERLRRGQIYANIGTWDWNMETNDLFWTERVAPLFGYPEGELNISYDKFISAVHPEDRQSVIDAVTACVERDVPYEIEHRVVWSDGTVRWLLERGAVLREPDGRAVKMLGVVQDIDDRKRAEIALAEREWQLREAQHLAKIGNWSANLLKGELYWSDEMYRIYGYEPGSIEPGIYITQKAVHPDDVMKVREGKKKLEERTGRFDAVHRILWPDGTLRHVHELAEGETNNSGQLIRLTGTVQDITEMVESEARLRETEERFAFAVDGAGDGVWDWDMRTDVMKFSKLYMEMLGYGEFELPHHADTWRSSLHPDDTDQILEHLKNYLEGRIPVYSVEIRLRCKDGDYKWILCRGRIVNRDADGNPIRMIGIHSDITQNKLTEQALIAARDEADQASRAKSEFLSSMSHELRTPMNAILGFGQLLEYDANLAEVYKESVREILNAGKHLLLLINEVLDLSKIESGHIDLSLEPVNLGELIEECFSMVKPAALHHGIEISHDDLDDFYVHADRTRLKQAIINLLSNAIKYNRKNGKVVVDVKTTEDEKIRIRISDTGPGIPSGRLSELFQPFNRLDAEKSEIEGTGIGLTITRRIVELMNGIVEVKSRVGEGSTFWIELPIEYPDLTSAIGETIAAPSRGIQNDFSKHKKVLYIEDNPSNLKLMVQLLSRHKHIHLHTAHTPELGVQLALLEHPNVILLDINMPGMSGYQVLDLLKSNESLKDIPVIALSAKATRHDIEEGKKADFYDYLTKPLDVPLFYEILDRCLSEH